jgi:hypothetical protein
MATILYARVSTVEQTIEHQTVQAKAAGFVIDEVVSDNGVSGVHTQPVVKVPRAKSHGRGLPPTCGPIPLSCGNSTLSAAKGWIAGYFIYGSFFSLKRHVGTDVRADRLR